MFETFHNLINSKREDLYFSRLWAALVRRITLIPQMILFYSPLSFYTNNRKKLASYKDKYKGKRCFIVANGPSLQKIDFSLLKDEYTFGMNRIYLMKEQNGFLPTFLACIDAKSHLIPAHEELDQQEMPCFFCFLHRKLFSNKPNQNFILSNYSPKFKPDATHSLGSGKSVTYQVMELAFYMGFNEVYIIGKDHNFNTTKAAGKGTASDGTDDNHFIKGYYKKGDVWSAPDLTGEEYAYSLARKAYEKDGRIIKDATIDGKLMVFEKVDFYSLFPNKK